jgi:hypothetical protein
MVLSRPMEYCNGEASWGGVQQHVAMVLWRIVLFGHGKVW